MSVLSTVPPGCALCDTTSDLYEYWGGTSMATPHVSAVAALVWSYDTSWTNGQVREALQQTARDIGSAGRDKQTGFGVVQAKAALDHLQGGSPPPPPGCTAATDCDDANECTTDACTDGACSNEPAADETACTNGVCCGGECKSGATSCTPAGGCGDGICAGGDENGVTCPADCRCTGKNCSASNCGNGVCEKTEKASNCPVDCG